MLFEMTMINPNSSAHEVVMSRVEGYGCNTQFDHCVGLGSSSSLSEIMADQEDDQSRTTESTVNEATASTSLLFNHDEQDRKDWLQLSIGGGISSSSATAAVELDLLPPPGTAVPIPTPAMNTNGGAASSNYCSFYNYNTSNMFMQQHHHGENIEFNWGGGFRPANVTRPAGTRLSPSPSPPSSRLVPPPPPPHGGVYFGQTPFFYHPGLGLAGPVPQRQPPHQRHSIDFRVIDPPPRRPSSSGIWFILQAAQNQAKEPYLPQIPKSFLRIKDAKMTIRIVMKYVVSKLKLEDESEVEIRCRGRQMEGVLTLQHVRDSIWNTTPSSSPSRTLALHPQSSTADHVMVLQYGRRSSA